MGLPGDPSDVILDRLRRAAAHQQTVNVNRYDILDGYDRYGDTYQVAMLIKEYKDARLDPFSSVLLTQEPLVDTPMGIDWARWLLNQCRSPVIHLFTYGIAGALTTAVVAHQLRLALGRSSMAQRYRTLIIWILLHCSTVSDADLLLGLPTLTLRCLSALVLSLKDFSEIISPLFKGTAHLTLRS